MNQVMPVILFISNGRAKKVGNIGILVTWRVYENLDWSIWFLLFRFFIFEKEPESDKNRNLKIFLKDTFL